MFHQHPSRSPALDLSIRTTIAYFSLVHIFDPPQEDIVSFLANPAYQDVMEQALHKLVAFQERPLNPDDLKDIQGFTQYFVRVLLQLEYQSKHDPRAQSAHN